MVEGEQVPVFCSICEGFLSLFSGLCGIGVKLDANGGIIKLHSIDVHKPLAIVEVADKRLGRISGDIKTEERGPPDSMPQKHLSLNNSGSK